MLGNDAKESYRDEFAKTLLEKGDDKTAMKIMAEQITATPEQAYALKSLFESKFPGGNFRGFFDTHVMGTWKMAPAFKLRTPDGKFHQLDDYKGKWLLLDFWGTWCSPCRQELPAINAFAAGIADSPTQAFLSIDCHDTELSLTSFLHDSKYTFPVVISDRQVEVDYAVTGYPTKILVTPNGRMLELSFGAPWQSILAQFIAIHEEGKKAAEPVQKANVNNQKNHSITALLWVRGYPTGTVLRSGVGASASPTRNVTMITAPPSFFISAAH